MTSTIKSILESTLVYGTLWLAAFLLWLAFFPVSIDGLAQICDLVEACREINHR